MLPAMPHLEKLLLALLPLLVAASDVPEVPAPVEQTWFVQRVTTGDAPLRVEYFWSKGSRFRSETVVAGRPILTLVSGEFYYVIDTLAATGVAIRRSSAALAADAERGRPFGREGEQMLAEGAEKVGTDDQTGRPCVLYRITDQRGRQEICLTPDELLLPIHSQQYARSSHRRVGTRYLDWAQGFPASDSFFVPDPRVELERIEYDAYLERSRRTQLGPAPVLYRDLLHGP
jgi:hypothetical protein